MENSHADDPERRLLDEGIIGGEELGRAADREGTGCLLSLCGLSLETPFAAGCLLVLLLPFFLIALAVFAVARALDPIFLILLILLIAAGLLRFWPKKKPPRTCDGP